MISVKNLSLHFGGRALFNDISYFIGKGEKVALAGINGSGKTTMLNYIAEKRDKAISIESGVLIGYLPQFLQNRSALSALEEVKMSVGDIVSLEQDVERITVELTERTDYESDSYMQLAEDIAVKSEKLALLEPEKLEGKALKILKGLGFSDSEAQKDYSSFSGGWKMRIELAKLLIQEPDLLLLDEPTNHLDIQSIIWFENYLQGFDGAAVIISHDQRFLDNVTNRTIEIIQGSAHDFPMSYTKYLDERALRVEHLSKTAKNQEKELKRTQELIDRFKAKASKASMAKSLQKKLDRTEQLDIPDFHQKEAIIHFNFSRPSGKEVLKVENLHKSFGDKQVLKNVNFNVNRGEKVALVGKNGIGKSTILKIVKGSLEKTEGEITFGHEVHNAFFDQDQGEQLSDNDTILKSVENAAGEDTYLQARAICGAFLFSGEDVDKKIKVLSGGERNRVALASIAINPYNTLILDEPTNHLDIPTKDRLKKALKEFPGTVIIVSHDRAFLHDLCNRILEVKDGEAKEFLGDIDGFIEKEKFNWLGIDEKPEKNKKQTETLVQKDETKDDWQTQKEKRNQAKKLEKAEQKIEELEGKKSKLESDMANSPDKMTELLKDYQKIESDLEKAYKDWESLSA